MVSNYYPNVLHTHFYTIFIERNNWNAVVNGNYVVMSDRKAITFAFFTALITRHGWHARHLALITKHKKSIESMNLKSFFIKRERENIHV